MIESIKILRRQGKQTIPDVTNVTLPGVFRGIPIIQDKPCADGCSACIEQCPTDAILLDVNGRISIDMGKCVFCGECAEVCPSDKISFSKNHLNATTTRKNLVIAQGMPAEVKFDADAIRKEIQTVFHKSLKLRQVSAAGCNACELELNACGNANFDMGRFGIEFVASPRHADGIVITGPISTNMSAAMQICHEAVPHPKIIVLTGACAISGGIFEKSEVLQRQYVEEVGVDLYVPGCPPHPLTFINGILQLIRKRN
ncbi:MAG: 4Fe-4S binding protein [Ignavibacteria bacterium]|nr:4Fe-4S binding protein [Ignavibacteria bacterium]